MHNMTQSEAPTGSKGIWIYLALKKKQCMINTQTLTDYTMV